VADGSSVGRVETLDPPDRYVGAPVDRTPPGVGGGRYLLVVGVQEEDTGEVVAATPALRAKLGPRPTEARPTVSSGPALPSRRTTCTGAGAFHSRVSSVDPSSTTMISAT
jgi:hypothetical protein